MHKTTFFFFFQSQTIYADSGSNNQPSEIDVDNFRWV